MAIPPNAKPVAQPMDPVDVLDFSATLTQGAATDSPAPLLLNGETVASFTLALTAEAIAAGLQIKSGGAYPAPTITGLLLVFWLAVDPAMQASAAFMAGGLTLALELTIVTSNNPARTKQRTLTVTVANQ